MDKQPEPTTEKMVERIGSWIGECDKSHEQGCHGCDESDNCIAILQAIRKRLEESDKIKGKYELLLADFKKRTGVKNG